MPTPFRPLPTLTFAHIIGLILAMPFFGLGTAGILDYFAARKSHLHTVIEIGALHLEDWQTAVFFSVFLTLAFFLAAPGVRRYARQQDGSFSRFRLLGPSKYFSVKEARVSLSRFGGHPRG